MQSRGAGLTRPGGSNGQFEVSEPPSISNTLPVTQLDAGEARYRAARAMSSTVPMRRMGVSASILPRRSSLRNGARAEVSTEPTAMALTRTRGANSCARMRVMNDSAALAVP